jgi:hypothetical protein
MTSLEGKGVRVYTDSMVRKALADSFLFLVSVRPISLRAVALWRGNEFL